VMARFLTALAPWPEARTAAAKVIDDVRT